MNRVAHQELIAVLEDDTRGNITTGGGVVTLNLRTLVVNIGTELGFGDELDARLPPDAGQIVILESDQLEAAQTGVKLIKWMSWLVILIAVALYAGAIWLARGRRSMLRNVGAALFIVGILLLVIRRAVGNYIVDTLSSGESVRDAIGSTWIIGTSLLAEVAWAAIIYGIVILIGTWLAGPMGYASPRAGMRSRRRSATAPGSAGAVLAGALPAARALGPGAGSQELARDHPARRARRARVRGVPAGGDRRSRARRGCAASAPRACLSFASSASETGRPSSSSTGASPAVAQPGGSSSRSPAAGRC